LLVTEKTERQYPVEALKIFEMFYSLSANNSRLGPNHELDENKIFDSKLTLNWIIYDWSVKKNLMLDTKKL
jgi:hypothetical protein